MNKQHLPYNILMILTVAALGLMIIFNLALRRSGFAVLVGYAIPAPPVSSAAPQKPADIPRPKLAEPQTESKPREYSAPVTDDAVFSVQFPLELNSATYEQLMFIPRVGNVTSQRIVQYRDHLGGYTQLEQLMEIKGIAEGTFEQISAYLYLENEAGPISDNVFEDEEYYGEHDAEDSGG